MLKIAKSARISGLAHIDHSRLDTLIEIGENVYIDSFVRISPIGGRGDVIIGSNCDINSGTVIFTGNGITLGDNVLVAPNCTFAPTNHAYHSREKRIREQGFLPSKGGIVIEDDVWIGAGCTILDGTILRKGCIIAAGSLVRGEVESYAIYGGNPLKKIGMRGEQTDGNIAVTAEERTDYTEEYARYYEIITQHKDYVAEAECLKEALKRQHILPSHHLLSVGCGVGLHERLLAQHFASVCGIDSSAPMINYGQKKNDRTNLELICKKLADLEESKFEAVISLFNVVNCVGSTEELGEFFTDIAKRLKPEGVLIFEAWNAQEININPPTVFIREYQCGQVSLKRVVTPHIHSKKYLELVYDISGEDAEKPVNFHSIHPIYLHSKEELESILIKSGFDELAWFSALSEGMQPMKATDRMMLCQAKKAS